MRLRALCIVLGLQLGGAALAQESAVRLVEAPGRDAVQASCLTCHSADYIVMNSPFLDEKGWRASVAKMINVMGAPITPEQADVIVRYLAANYGAPRD
jgi:sulfite dehydrogenase (cytochrome) subunit B